MDKAIEGLFSWRDAYRTPFILIQGLDEDLEGFQKVHIYSRVRGSTEFSFIRTDPLSEGTLKDFVQIDGFVNKSLFQTDTKRI